MKLETEFALPPHLHRPFTLAKIRSENHSTRTLFFRERLPAQPGQFVMAWLPGVDEKPFSIAAAEPLALTVAAVGPFSRAMHNLPVGDRVWVRGPLGQGFRLDNVTGRRLLLVGGGYGVAPLFFLAQEAIAQGCTIEVCIGAQTAEDVLLVKDFESTGVAVHVTTEDGSLGSRGLVTIATEVAIAHNQPGMVCACGPAKMLEAIDKQCERHNLPRQLSWEAHMRCGMGLCGSCELPIPESDSEQVWQAGCQGSGWLVCLDGPVSFLQPERQ
jgi:dihydroorotate dehydrogenase electron transfer subunit